MSVSPQSTGAYLGAKYKSYTSRASENGHYELEHLSTPKLKSPPQSPKHPESLMEN